MSSRSMIDRSIAPAVHPVPLMPIPGVETIMLPNGIRLVLLRSNEIDRITRITLSWNGGAFDALNQPAAELAARLARSGGANIKPDEMADLLDFNGAHLASELSSHNNSMTLLALNRSIDTLLSAVIDTLNNPMIDGDEFRSARSRMAAERATALESVTTHADELNTLLSFGQAHPAARTYSPDQINNVTLDEVTAAHISLKGRQTPVVYVAGNLSASEIELITDRLSQLDCRPTDLGCINVIDASPAESVRRFVEVPHSLQAAVKISTPTINRSYPDYEAVRIMTTALGGYFGSRLMSNIREEKGLTYGINAGVYGYREGAFITVSCQCDNKYVEQVLTEVENEIERLATEPMGQDELEAVRQTMTGSLLSTLNTPFNIMDYYILQRHVLTPPDYFSRQQEALMRATPESIRDTARKYLTGRRRLISVAGRKI